MTQNLIKILLKFNEEDKKIKKYIQKDIINGYVKKYYNS